MTNGHAEENSVVPTAPTGGFFLVTNPLHYVNQIFLENGTIAKRNGAVFWENSTRCCEKLLLLNHQRLMERFLVQGATWTAATAIPVRLKWPLTLGIVAVVAHLCVMLWLTKMPHWRLAKSCPRTFWLKKCMQRSLKQLEQSEKWHRLSTKPRVIGCWSGSIVWSINVLSSTLWVPVAASSLQNFCAQWPQTIRLQMMQVLP